jgi:hypothetical protein
VEFHAPVASDPKQVTIDAGAFPSASDGTLEIDAQFSSGALQMVAAFDGFSGGGSSVGAGPFTLGLPNLGTETIKFKAALAWSFTIMTKQEYEDYFGGD